MGFCRGKYYFLGRVKMVEEYKSGYKEMEEYY